MLKRYTAEENPTSDINTISLPIDKDSYRECELACNDIMRKITEIHPSRESRSISLNSSDPCEERVECSDQDSLEESLLTGLTDLLSNMIKS